VDLDVISADDPEVKRGLNGECYHQGFGKGFPSWIRLKGSAAWFLKGEVKIMMLGQERTECCASAGLIKDNLKI